MPALLLLLSVVPLAAQTARDPWTVSGRVLNALDLSPIPKATVVMTPEDSRAGPAQSASTDSDGAFRFTGTSAGRFRFIARHPRLLEARYGARSPRAPGIPVALERGAEPRRIELLMTPPSAIGGRVLDDEGEPLGGVPVVVLLRQYQRGRLVWMPAGASPVSRSDDRGEYKAFGLQPGRYVVAATPSNYFTAGDGRPRGGQAETMFGSLFFPNGKTIDEAQVLDVKPGAELRGIDLRLRKTPVFRVKGKVVAPDGWQKGTLNIMKNRWSTTGVNLREDGSFELKNLERGVYTLFVRVEGAGPQLTVRSRLEVTDSDIDGLILQPEAAHTVNGRVQYPEGAKPAPVTVLLRNLVDDMFFAVLSTTTKAGGGFEIRDVPPGRYRVEVSAADPKWYAQAVKADNAGVLDSEFTIAGPVRVEVVMAADAGAVEGEVLRDEKPVAGAVVVLAPNGPRRYIPHYFRCGSADVDGRFHILGAVPGGYTLLAFEDVDPDRCGDPELIEEHERKGLRVEVEVGATHRLNIQPVRNL